ncbi:MAG: hypothetical protein AAFW81_09750 [Pseudomonadota bacterium]
MIAAGFAWLAALSDAAASPWNPPDGELLVIARADYFTSDLGLLSVDGVDVPGEFERLESNTYLEYGVSERWMIGGKAFYGTSWLRRGDATERASGFTEVEGFVQRQLFRSPRHAGAIKVATSVPSSFDSGVRPSLASDGVDAEFSALYGRTLSYRPVAAFAAVEVGYRKRFSDSADELRFLTTLGAEPIRNVVVLVDTFSVKSVRNERPGGADFDIVKVQPSLIYRFSRRFAVQAGVSEEVAGRNISLGRTWFAGVRGRF